MAAVLEAKERINCVHIEGLALLKIIKHCHESLPHMVTGSLLGLSNGGGILEVTHAFPFPDPQQLHNKHNQDDATDKHSAAAFEESMEGHEFQLEMMRMLREVNVDNNCVGWYQSMYLGIFSTSSLLENQLSYQTDLSPNAVVVLYDPIQTRHGKLVLKCYRLSDQVVKLKNSSSDSTSTGSAVNVNSNAFVDPSAIFEQVPIKLTNPGLATALLADLEQQQEHPLPQQLQGNISNNSTMMGRDVTFDRLDLSTHPYLEKHLEFICNWVDDLTTETHKFQYYARQMNRDKTKRMGTSSDAPRRMESLLISNQISHYCAQMSDFSSDGLTKLFASSGLQRQNQPKPQPSS